MVVGKYVTEDSKKKDPACEKLRIAAFDMVSAGTIMPERGITNG